MLMHPSATDLAQRLAEQLTAKLRDLNGQDIPSDPASSRVMDNLVSTISRLQVENEMLKEELQAVKTAQLASPAQVIGEETGRSQGSQLTKFVTFHEVICRCNFPRRTVTSYLDPPRLFRGDTKNDHFRGTHEVGHREAYLEGHPEVSFVVVRAYQCAGHTILSILNKEGHLGPRGWVLMKDHHVKETDVEKVLAGPAAQAGLKAIIEAFPHRFPGFEAPPRLFDLRSPNLANIGFRQLDPPFNLFYLYGKRVTESLGEVDVDEMTRESLRLLCQWMEDNFRKQWDKADALFARGKVNRKHFTKLFQPGELVVCHDPNEGKRLNGTIVPWSPSHMDSGSGINLLSSKFNGVLMNSYVRITAESELGSVTESDTPIDITSLGYYPLRFAQEGIKAKLIARGQRFWACRHRKLVCCSERNEGSIFQVCLGLILSRHVANLEQAEKRFMVDYDMFRRLHPNNPVFSRERYGHIRASNEFIGIEEPPDEFLCCLPPQIHGFDFTTKTWSQYFQ